MSNHEETTVIKPLVGEYVTIGESRNVWQVTYPTYTDYSVTITRIANNRKSTRTVMAGEVTRLTNAEVEAAEHDAYKGMLKKATR